MRKTISCNVRQSEYDDEYGEVPFLRTSDLGVMELRPTIQKVPLAVYAREKGVQDLRPLDILIIKDGTYRIGEPVMLQEDDLKIVVQGHFYKIRVLNDQLLNPYFLLYALRKSQSFIVESAVVQATLSSMTISRMREIPITYPSSEEQASIANGMRKILEQRQIHRKELDKI